MNTPSERETLVCSHCGTQFPYAGKGPPAKYCGDNCRQQHFYHTYKRRTGLRYSVRPRLTS